MWSTLISPAELLGHLDDPACIVFDCRNDLTDRQAGRRAFEAGHIPGARHVHIEEILSGPIDARSGRHPLPSPETFCERMAALGMRRNFQAVAYDGAGGVVASRLWWMLRWVGHDTVAVLDGGWNTWISRGMPTATSSTTIEPGDFRLAGVRPWTVDADFLERHLGSPNVLIVDARARDRFRGENETLDPVGGRIPGARNRPFTENLTADGLFKDASTLAEEFASLLAGAAPEKVVHQCGSGVSACHNLLAMEVAGRPGARLYPGSWSEWCADPKRPIARG
jgi:thiosulfate/3-mercaptopyruvate sulfurtransferase